MGARMNLDEAQAAVLEALERRGVGGLDGIAITSAKEKPYGWVFLYNSRRYVETGELIYSLVGGGPVVVVAATRQVHELGSARPAEVEVHALEERLQLHPGT